MELLDVMLREKRCIVLPGTKRRVMTSDKLKKKKKKKKQKKGL